MRIIFRKFRKLKNEEKNNTKLKYMILHFTRIITT